MLLNSGEIGAPCGVPFRSRRARFVRRRPPRPVVLLHRHLQPRLDPAQQPPVAHAAGDGPEQVGVRNLAVVVRQVGVHHLPVARRQQPVNAPDRVMRAPARPIGVLLRLQVGLEDRRQHQRRRRLRHPVPETRNAQRPETSEAPPQTDETCRLRRLLTAGTDSGRCSKAAFMVARRRWWP